MKKLLAFLCVIAVVFGVAGAAGATVLDFEDWAPTEGFGNIPDGYHGFGWSNVAWLHGGYMESILPLSYYDVGVVSGQYAAANLAGVTATIDDGSFNFTGAYFSSAWDYVVPNPLSATGYLNGVEIYPTVTVGLLPGNPIFYTFDFLGIDELILATESYQFVMDDFTYSHNLSAVPEPATMLLLGTGLMGMAVIGRKKIFPKK